MKSFQKLAAVSLAVTMCMLTAVSTYAADTSEVYTKSAQQEALVTAEDDTQQIYATKGDLNGDGKVAVADVVILQKSIAKLFTLNSEQSSMADYNGDGKITVSDTVAIQKEIAKADTPVITSAPKIYLSPSNQNGNIYATGDTNEMLQCNKIANALYNRLTAKGYNVKKAPQGQAMATSIAESNSFNPDLHLCIHTNAFNGSYTGGTMVMVYSFDTKNEAAGQSILNAVAPITPGNDYDLKAMPDLAELNNTNSVAVYCEVEFHDTETGANWIINHTDDIADAI